MQITILETAPVVKPGSGGLINPIFPIVWRCERGKAVQ